MKRIKNRRRQTFANRLHKQIFLLVVLSALLPLIIATICLYYLIFGITALEIGIPETVAYHIMPAAQKVTIILLTVAPITILLILIFALRVTHRIVGPYDRIVRELDEHLENKRTGHIILREKDKFQPLVDRINRLLDRLKNNRV